MLRRLLGLFGEERVLRRTGPFVPYALGFTPLGFKSDRRVQGLCSRGDLFWESQSRAGASPMALADFGVRLKLSSWPNTVLMMEGALDRLMNTMAGGIRTTVAR